MKPVFANPFRRAVVPLAFYYAVTLAVPLANGTEWWDGRFLGHAAAVLLMPLILSTLVYGICGIVWSIVREPRELLRSRLLDRPLRRPKARLARCWRST